MVRRGQRNALYFCVSIVQVTGFRGFTFSKLPLEFRNSGKRKMRRRKLEVKALSEF